jgi:signal transduction histidine kinase/DNA-binding response OmpR family regulator
MYKHLLLLLCFILFNLSVDAQSDDIKILDSLDYIYCKDINCVPADTTIKRIKNFIKTYDALNIKDSTNIVKKGKAYTQLMLMFSRKRKKDSVDYYYNMTITNFQNPKVKSEAHRIMALTYMFAQDANKALQFYDKALQEAKLDTNENTERTILLELSLFYRYAEDFEDARDILTELTKKDTLNFRTVYEDVYIKFHFEEYNEALNQLKQVDSSAIKDKLMFRAYHEAFVDAYINLKQYDAALHHNDIAVKDSRSIASFSPIDDYTYYAKIYHKKGENNKALSYLNKIPDTSVASNSNFSLKDFHELSYLVHKSLGNAELAFKNYEKYHDIKAVFDEEIKQKQAGILKYKLNKDKVLNALKTKQIEENLKKKQELYAIVFAFIAVIILLLVLFFINKIRQNRKEFKLKQNTKLNKLKNQYLENITHEFKTPLSVIIGYQDLVKANLLNPSKAIHYIEKTQQAQHKLMTSLNEFLTFIRLENNSKIDIYLKENLILYDFLVDTLQGFEPLFLSKGSTLNFKTNIHKNSTLSFNYSRLEKVINNLVDNAIKFSEVNQSVNVRFMVTDSEFLLIVEDQGKGISSEDQSKIFSRFFQTYSGKQSNGFGIGLYLVNEIVRSLNGEINVESTLGQGTSFTISIPLNTEELVGLKASPVEMVLFEKDTATTEQDRYNILIVDDQYEMLEYITEILPKDYTCDHAFSAEEALHKIETSSYDLIISDYKMAEMSGYQLKLKLNENKKTSTIPFILISAFVINENFLDIEDSKGFIFLQKPFKDDNLIQIVNTFIRKKTNAKIMANTSETAEVEMDNEIQAFINKTNAYIINNLRNENLQVEDIANHLDLDKNTFSKLIKEYTGKTTIKIIIEIRLLKAYEYFKSAKYMTINETRIAVGINNRSYFNKKFTERFGVKPGDMFNAYKN